MNRSKDIQSAKKLLKQNSIGSISPVSLVAASTSLGKSLSDTLNLIAYLKGGQQFSQFPQLAKLLTGEYE